VSDSGSVQVQGYVLPLKPYPVQVRVTLLGTTYLLRTRWSNGQSCWILDLSDTDGNLIIGSIPLVTGVDLLAQFGYEDIGGGLYVYNTSGDPYYVPQYGDLGVLSQLVFVPYPVAA
jgi:hypothetical protein